MRRAGKRFGARARAWIEKTMAKAYAPRDHTTYRSAAAAQLLDIDDRFSIFRKERTVLDLGCFAGGWLEVARECSDSQKLLLGI